jgi:DNA-binding response OmpR family regulator
MRKIWADGNDIINKNRRDRILVIDDESDICSLYHIVLEDADFDCSSYTDSVKAIKEFKPNYYGLILLDIKMPLLNGFELCKKIREIDNTIQIIFITASEEYYNKVRQQYYPELGGIASIQKPISNKKLVKEVNLKLATVEAN